MGFLDRFKTQSETHTFDPNNGTWSDRWRPEYERASRVEVVDRSGDGISLAIDYEHFANGQVVMDDVYLPRNLREASNPEIVAFFTQQGFVGSWAQNVAMQYHERGEVFPFC